MALDSVDAGWTCSAPVPRREFRSRSGSWPPFLYGSFCCTIFIRVSGPQPDILFGPSLRARGATMASADFCLSIAVRYRAVSPCGQRSRSPRVITHTFSSRSPHLPKCLLNRESGFAVPCQLAQTLRPDVVRVPRAEDSPTSFLPTPPRDDAVAKGFWFLPVEVQRGLSPHDVGACRAHTYGWADQRRRRSRRPSASAG